MSIRVMSRVWDHSERSGGDLLLLLALADFADDDGYCWPSQATLAIKARCSERAIRDQLTRLAASGEIEVSDGRGRGRRSTVRVIVGEAKAADVAAIASPKAADRRAQKRQVATVKAAGCDTHIDNHQEPSDEPSITPADAGGALAPAAAPSRVLFGDLCWAAGWSSRDLTPGNREQLGQLAARVLEEPEADRPDRDDLRGIYQSALASLSERLRRPADSLTVLQFRQAIGAWITANRRAAEEAEAWAERARAEAIADAEARRLDAERRATSSASPAAAAAGAWAAVAQALRPSVPPATWAQWLAHASPADLADGILTVRVPSEQHVDWISRRLTDLLGAAASRQGLQGVQFQADALQAVAA